MLPLRHFVDAGYIDAELLVDIAEKYDIELFGPTRFNPSWQARTGGYDTTRFAVDWHRRLAMCPEGKKSVYWHKYQTKEPYLQQMVKIKFKVEVCRHCLNRTKCVKTESSAGRQ